MAIIKQKQSKDLRKQASSDEKDGVVSVIKISRDSLPISGVVVRPHRESDVHFRVQRSSRFGQFGVSAGTTFRILEKAVEDKIFPELEPEDVSKEKA